MATYIEECSECGVKVTLDFDNGGATATVPSNGVRGRRHVPAHEATTETMVDGELFLWECPVCGYADSTYHDPETRKALA